MTRPPGSLGAFSCPKAVRREAEPCRNSAPHPRHNSVPQPAINSDFCTSAQDRRLVYVCICACRTGAPGFSPGEKDGALVQKSEFPRGRRTRRGAAPNVASTNSPGATPQWRQRHRPERSPTMTRQITRRELLAAGTLGMAATLSMAACGGRPAQESESINQDASDQEAPKEDGASELDESPLALIGAFHSSTGHYESREFANGTATPEEIAQGTENLQQSEASNGTKQSS